MSPVTKPPRCTFRSTAGAACTSFAKAGTAFCPRHQPTDATYRPDPASVREFTSDTDLDRDERRAASRARSTASRTPRTWASDNRDRPKGTEPRPWTANPYTDPAPITDPGFELHPRPRRRPAPSTDHHEVRAGDSASHPGTEGRR